MLKVPRCALALTFVFAVTILVSGCSDQSYELAPVSGKVQLDGQPLPNARVILTPQSESEITSGPTSVDVTDGDGRFHMHTIDGQAGAVVGLHYVKITTYQEKPDPNNVHRIVVESEERIPTHYQKMGALTCEVPGEGLTELEFNLSSTSDSE